jgi:hypothetical protein
MNEVEEINLVGAFAREITRFINKHRRDHDIHPTPQEYVVVLKKTVDFWAAKCSEPRKPGRPRKVVKDMDVIDVKLAENDEG